MYSATDCVAHDQLVPRVQCNRLCSSRSVFCSFVRGSESNCKWPPMKSPTNYIPSVFAWLPRRCCRNCQLCKPSPAGFFNCALHILRSVSASCQTGPSWRRRESGRWNRDVLPTWLCRQPDHTVSNDATSYVSVVCLASVQLTAVNTQVVLRAVLISTVVRKMCQILFVDDYIV